MIANARVARHIHDALKNSGIEAIVTARGHIIRLEGLVESEEMRTAASDVVHEIDPTALIDNDLDVMAFLPLPDQIEAEPEAEQLTAALHELGDETERAALDRQREGTIVDEETWARSPGTAEPYFPPTDPVVQAGPHGIDILGGFAATSLDEVSTEERGAREAGARARSDDEIADDVRRELAEDSATADLQVRVHVVRGVARLTGTVSSLDDAEAAEEVAARVPDVEEVDERLEIAGSS